MSKTNKYIYAVYKGDKFITEGTAEECAEYCKVTITTIYCWACKLHSKRMSKKRLDGKPRNAKIAFVIGSEEE